MKFRAWIPEEIQHAHMIYSANEDPDLGYFAFNEEGHLAVYELWDKIVDGFIVGCDSIERKDATIMQFTGLTDKNGVEIWEGDIVQYPDFYVGDSIVPSGIEVIEWELNGFNSILCFGYAEYPDYVEVIGNIFENPSLLEDKG